MHTIILQLPTSLRRSFYKNVFNLGILMQEGAMGLGTSLGLGLPVTLGHIPLPGKGKIFKTSFNNNNKKLHLPLLSSRCLKMQ